MKKAKTPNGFVLFEGKSRIDGSPIVALATGFNGGNNKKTGEMIQVYILKQDYHPCTAKKEEKDFSICGDCKHRDFGSCYVELLRGPISVYRSYKKGKYPKITKKYENLFKGQYIRWGAYGDPVAIPFNIVKKYSDIANGHTGYTHQWKRAKNKKYKNYLMASVDSTDGYYKEFIKAHDNGWRTFRTTTRDDNFVFSNEMVCPASAEAGKLTDCNSCKSCNGLKSLNRKNPVIKVHGFGWKIEHFEKGMKALKNKKKYRTKKIHRKVNINIENNITIVNNVYCENKNIHNVEINNNITINNNVEFNELVLV